jgi:orotidine-5'-phosphate decarboxylase
MIDNLINMIKLKGNSLCIGLDTTIDIIPNEILENEINKKWYTSRGYTSAILKFNKIIIDIVHEFVPAILVNITYYEKYGVSGLKVFMDTINYAKEKGLITIGDIKRSEYVESYLGKLLIHKIRQSSYNSDFITTNPYLGIETIEPFVEDCKNYKKGMFVILKTVGKDFKDLIIEDPNKPGARNPLYYKLADDIDNLGKYIIGENGFSSIGAVVGSTHSSQLKYLREQYANMFFLLPENKIREDIINNLIPAFYRKDKLGALIVKSDKILTAYKNPTYSGLSLEKAILEETKNTINQIESSFNN